MKTLYFLSNHQKVVLDVAVGSVEPDYIAKFPLAESESVLPFRYALVGGDKVDLYANLSDSEVVGVFLTAGQPPTTLISPVSLKMRFTSAERVAIYASTDPAVIDFLRILDDPRLMNVDKTSATTLEAFDHLIRLELLNPIRKTEILL